MSSSFLHTEYRTRRIGQGAKCSVYFHWTPKQRCLAGQRPMILEPECTALDWGPVNNPSGRALSSPPFICLAPHNSSLESGTVLGGAAWARTQDTFDECKLSTCSVPGTALWVREAMIPFPQKARRLPRWKSASSKNLEMLRTPSPDLQGSLEALGTSEAAHRLPPEVSLEGTWPTPGKGHRMTQVCRACPIPAFRGHDTGGRIPRGSLGK